MWLYYCCRIQSLQRAFARIGEKLEMQEDKPPRSDPWSNLSTIRKFDRGNRTTATVPIDSTFPVSKDRQIVSVNSSASLLIVSLLRLLCTTWEPDVAKSRELCLVICKEFAKLNLIDASYTQTEYEPLRHGYQRVLYHMIAFARVLSGNEGPLRTPSGFTLGWSRYQREFVEICRIGDGGFGTVYKAVNQLDGVQYAVKKIEMSKRNIEMDLAEVRALAQLDHPNIVPYKNAWTERYLVMSSLPCLPAPTNAHTTTSGRRRRSHKVTRSHRASRDHAISCTDEASLLYDTGSSGRRSQQLAETSEAGSSDVVVYRYDSNSNKFDGCRISSSAESGELSNNQRLSRYNSAGASRYYTTLYIQMTLCDRTLESFLMDRTERITDATYVAITKQILRGVEYLHSMNIVHHDIKPANIFITFTEPYRVHVGDFGLTCLRQGGRHVGKIGTRGYAAPEQLAGECNQKSDVYSVGIVMLELLVPGATRMELNEIIETLQCGDIPDNHFHEQTRERRAQLIGRMIRRDPSTRLTCSEVLEELPGDVVEEIVRLEKTIRDQSEQIEAQREQILNLIKENSRLKSKVREETGKIQPADT